MSNDSFFYSDFYVNFNVHPTKRDLVAMTDATSIASSIKNIIFTNKYERPFAPTFGAGIPRTLFDNTTSDSKYLLETLAKEAIEASEKRATKVRVAVVMDEERNGYHMTIFFTPINTTDTVAVEAFFKRVR